MLRRLGLLTLCIALLMTARLFSTTYYIDYVSGSDSNVGTSKGAPWQHAPGMKGCTGNCSNHVVASTDQYMFKGGVVWPSAVLPWTWTGGSTSTANTSGYSGVYLGIDPTWNNGTVISVRPTSSGYNCTSIKVTLSGGGGSGATATANFMTSGYLAGLLQHVTVTNSGSGYTSNPDVSFAGSTCTQLPTAVADIYSPIIDSSGTVWNESNGSTAGYGPIKFAFVNYLTVDHFDFRGMKVDHTIAPGSGELAMVNQQGGDNTTWQNIYVHNVGPDVICLAVGSPSGCTTYSFNGTAGMVINQGYGGLHSTVKDSFFDNYENEVFAACGWSNNSAISEAPPCGSSRGIAGASTLANNYVHDFRGMVYSNGTDQFADYHGNMLWNSVQDCCQQHEDAFYFFGGGVIYNNILHDLATGAAAFYIETTNGAVGNTTYIFNNVIWNVGQSTPPIGISSEFWGNSALSSTPNMYAWNNTLYARAGTTDCINAGQWYGISASSTVNIFLYNNHCISDQTGVHWFDSNGSDTAGIWNGLSSPNSTSTRTAIDVANTVMTPSAAANQGYTIANAFAPSGSSNSTVIFSGKSYSGLCSSIPSACLDNRRISRLTSSWNSGAYQYDSPLPPIAPKNPVTLSH